MTRRRGWEADSGLFAESQAMGESASWSMTYSPDGRRIVTASDDHTARGGKPRNANT